MTTFSRRLVLVSTTVFLITPLAAAAQQAGLGPLWSSGPKGLGPGVSVSLIDDNRATDSYTVHVRYPAGHTVGPHKHKSTEHVTVLSGTLLVGWGSIWDPTEFKEVRAGEFVEVPSGVVHFSAVREETVMEVRITGRYEIEFVLDADDPREAKR